MNKCIKQEDEVLQTHLNRIRKKLTWDKVEFPPLTIETMDYNIEMIGADDGDIITLFQEGIITKIQLMKYLEKGLPEKIESL